MINNTMKIILFAAVLACLMFFTGCYSVPKEVSDDLGPYDIIQQAQSYYDKGNIPAAEYMYNVLLDRYGTDTTYRIIAQYEIAHIWVKAGKYQDAIPMFEEIISCYDSVEIGELPGKYLVLARNDLQRAQYSITGTKKTSDDEE